MVEEGHVPKRISKPRRVKKKATPKQIGDCGICGDTQVPLGLCDNANASFWYDHDAKGWVSEHLDVCVPCSEAWLAWLIRVCALLRKVASKTTNERVIKLANRLHAEAYQDEFPELEKWEEKFGFRKAS